MNDFLYDGFRLQGKTGKTKMKNNKIKKKLLRNIFVFRNFCQPERKMKNGMKSSIDANLSMSQKELFTQLYQDILYGVSKEV